MKLGVGHGHRISITQKRRARTNGVASRAREKSTTARRGYRRPCSNRARLLHGRRYPRRAVVDFRSEEHTSELQSRSDLVCRLLLEKKKNKNTKKSNMISAQ